MDIAKKSLDVKSRFPDKDIETIKFGKPYICDVIYTIVGGQFKQWVSNEIDKRNEEVATKGNLNIAVDPEIAKAFQNSTAVSSKCSLGCAFLQGLISLLYQR